MFPTKKTALLSFILGLSLLLNSLPTHAQALGDDELVDFSFERFSELDANVSISLENIYFDKFSSVGKIVGSYRKARFLSNDDIVYMEFDGVSASVGDRFLVYKDNGKVKLPGTILGKKGRHIHIKAVIEVTEVSPKFTTGKVMNATENVFLKDKLAPAFNLVVDINPQEPMVDLTGRIVKSADDEVMIGAYKFAFIDKGTKHGLRVNDQLSVYRSGDGKTRIHQALPNVDIAELVVVHATESTATVYCMNSIEAFEAGAHFRSKRDIVKYLDDTSPVSSMEFTMPSVE